MGSHGLRPVGLKFKSLYLEATRSWHVQHEFSDCRCDIVFVRHKEIFLTIGLKKSKLRNCQSLAPGLKVYNIYVDYIY